LSFGGCFLRESGFSVNPATISRNIIKKELRMFEKQHQRLAPLSVFFTRLGRHMLLGVVIILITLYLGMVGYHHFEHMGWIDSFNNAAMILSDMGPATPLTTDAGKLFAGIYALFCGLIFIFIMGIIFSPIIHRFLHKFHYDDPKDSSSST